MSIRETTFRTLPNIPEGVNRDLLEKTREPIPRKDPEYFIGDDCPTHCQGENGQPGRIGVYTVRRQGGLVIRYLCCKVCRWKPPNNKLILPE